MEDPQQIKPRPTKSVKFSGRGIVITRTFETSSVEAEVQNQTQTRVSSIVQPTHNPLTFYTVLKNLFSFFLVHELKTARLVCTEWYKIASPFLSKESRVSILCGQRQSQVTRFLQCTTNKSFGFMSVREKSRNKKLYTNFSVRNLRLASRSELNLFQVHGPWMRELSLFSIYLRNYDSLLKLIYHQLPNLVSFKIVSRRGLLAEDGVDQYFESLPPLPDETIAPFSLNLKTFDISNYDKVNLNPDECTVSLRNFFRKCDKLQNLTIRGLYPFLTVCLQKVYEACKGKSEKISSLKIQLLNYEYTNETTQFVQAATKVFRRFHLRTINLDLKLSPREWETLFQQSTFSSVKQLSIIFTPISSPQIRDFEKDYFSSIFLPPEDQQHHNSNNNSNCCSSSNGETEYEPKFQNLTRLSLLFNPSDFDKNFRLSFDKLRVSFPNVTSLSWRYQNPTTFSYSCNSRPWHSKLPNIFEDLSHLFPNTKSLEVTIGGPGNFCNLVSSFTFLEELKIAQESYALSDLDLLGPSRFFGEPGETNNKRLVDDEGIFSIPRLNRLYLNNDCLRLTNKCIDRGFLQMPQLVVLKLYSHAVEPKQPPSITTDRLEALQRKNFVSLDILLSKSGSKGTCTIFQC